MVMRSNQNRKVPGYKKQNNDLKDTTLSAELRETAGDTELWVCHYM